MRHSLGITVAQLAKASGMPDSTLETIERGGRTTRGERHDIAVAVAWLADNRVAKGT
jgi:transcriptional regulator with XRE-family HTH domain